MLNEVRQSILTLQFIARPRFDQQSAVSHIPTVFEVHTTQPIGQCPSVKGRRVWRHGPRRYG